MSGNILTEIIDTLQELGRMHQLNLELLEQLDVTCGWLLDNKVHVPNEDHLVSLLSKARALFEEIRDSELKVLQYSAIRRKVTDKTSDGKVPESYNIIPMEEP